MLNDPRNDDRRQLRVEALDPADEVEEAGRQEIIASRRFGRGVHLS